MTIEHGSANIRGWTNYISKGISDLRLIITRSSADNFSIEITDAPSEEVMRTFSYGDPGLPKNGLLIGDGGGFSWRYTDVVLHTSGVIERLEYETPGGPIPKDYLLTGGGKGNPAKIVDFIDKLSANGFCSMETKPPQSDAFEYIVGVDEKKGAHSLIYVLGGSDCPDVISSIRKDIYDYAMKAMGI